jgi:molybdenum cofactor cytidylyltransferase
MGTQKLLLPFAGTTVVAYVVKQLAASPLDGVVVVVSPEGEKICAEARTAGATTVLNPEPDADMLSSVRCGLRALPLDCDAAVVALGDQPTIPPGLVSDLIAALSSRPGAIIVPTHAGQRGHPVLISARWFEDILTRYEGIGLRGLLAEHPESVVELPVHDERVLHDMDDPDAYRRALDASDG